MKQKLLLAITMIAFLTTSAQITLLKEINNSGTSSSSPENLFVFNNKIYFAADDSNGSNTPGGADLGKELWITDGTTNGTTFVKDIRSGNANSSIQNFFIFNSKLYFTAFSTASELWTSDGTEVGTTLADLMPSITGESPQRFLELNGLAYFTVGGQPGSGAETTNKLVEWNGTDSAVQVADVGDGYEIILSDMIALDNKILIYMSYSTTITSVGNELYSYDPSSDTFTLIKDINTGDEDTDTNADDSNISDFVKIGSTVYFKANQGSNTSSDVLQLWQTDGTESGTKIVNNTSSILAVGNLFNWNGILYFQGNDGSNNQLWKYDPTTETVTKISNIATDHNPSDFAAVGSYLYYAARPLNSPDSFMFRTNGTIIEQVDNSIKDIDDIVVLNNKLFFEGDNGTTGNELYMLDPTTLSIESVSKNTLQIYPNPASEFIQIASEYLNSSYKIYSILGQVVKEGTITSSQISVSGISKGNYVLKVSQDDKVATQKLIIQ
jgi:ELWxxDGT repeat protein